MSERRETIADIIAEKRFDATTRDQFDSAYIVDFCDRLEAALKRELGDAAKLREALKLCLRGMCGYCRMDAEARGMTTECVNGCQAMLDAKAALAVPARNCDRFTNETDAQIAFLNEVCLIGVTSLKDDPFDGWAKQMKERYVQWLLAPATAKEGGAK